MAVYSARQSTYTTGDTVTAAHTNNEFNAILAAFHVSTGHTHDGTTAGDGGPLSTLYSNTISMGTGADTDIAVTFNANSNDGVLTWMEDEDYFKFSDDVLINSTEKLYFYDTGIYLYSSTNGQLDVVADGTIQVTAPTVNIEASTAATIESDSITLGENGNTDVVLTFNASSNDGVLTWMEDEDYFKFSDEVLIDSTEKLHFRDTAIYLYSSADGQLDLVADTEIQIAATTIDMNGAVDVSGTLSFGSLSDGSVTITDIADEDNMSSNSATKLATQQSIKAYVDTAITAEDLDVTTDSGTIAIDLDSETLTIAGGTGLDSSATSNTVTLAIDSTVATLTGSQTLTNKTLTSPVLNTGVSGTAILDEDNLASDSATKLATQQSIKAYVDGQVSGVSTSWVLEDDDGTEVTVASGKEVKFIGSGVTTNWTDTDNGTDGDPYDLTFTIDAAQTGITSILATDLKIGEDNETKIDFETVNEIHFYANNTEQVYLADNIFGPQSDSDVDLGTTSVRWKDAYVDSVTITDNLTVGGNLTVNGTTTTVNSTTVTVDDPIFTLGGDSAPGSDDNKDRGIEFRWHTGTAAKVGFFGYDDSAEVFTFIPDASNSSEVFSGTVGNVAFGNIAGTLTTAAQTNITSVGALDGGSISSGFGAIDTGSSNITTTGLISGGSLDIDDVLINGTTIGHTDDTDLMTLSNGGLVVAGTLEATGNITGTLATAAQTNITSTGALDGGSITSGFGAIDNGTSGIRTNTFTAETSILPDAAGGADLGSTSAEWGDIYVADDKKIYFGSDQDVSMEYDEDGTDTLLVSGDVTIADDKKLYFGTGKDVSIEYDEDGIDTLLIAGGDVTIADDKKLYFGSGKDVSLEYDEDGNDTLSINGDALIEDDKKLYLGSGKDFSIEYDEDGNDTTAVVAAGGISMAPHGSSAGNGTELRFQELAANGANYVGFKAPDSIASNEVWVLPNADGSADQVLKTDGSNALSWTTVQASPTTTATVSTGKSVANGDPVIVTSTGTVEKPVSARTASVKSAVNVETGGSHQTTRQVRHGYVKGGRAGTAGGNVIFRGSYSGEGVTSYYSIYAHATSVDANNAITSHTETLLTGTDRIQGHDDDLLSDAIYDPDTDRFILFYIGGTQGSTKNTTHTNTLNYVMMTQASTSPYGMTVHTKQSMMSDIGADWDNPPKDISAAYDTVNNRVWVSFKHVDSDDTSTAPNNYHYAICGTVTGGTTNTIAWGDILRVDAAASDDLNHTSHSKQGVVTADPDQGGVAFTWVQAQTTSGGTERVRARVLTVNTGTNAITKGTRHDVSTTNGYYNFGTDCIYDENTDRFIWLWKKRTNETTTTNASTQGGTTYYASLLIRHSTNATFTSSTAFVSSYGNAINDGEAVADGETNTGSTAASDSGGNQFKRADKPRICMDTSTNKCIVVYGEAKDGSNVGKQYAELGTVTGGTTNTITFDYNNRVTIHDTEDDDTISSFITQSTLGRYALKSIIYDADSDATLIAYIEEDTTNNHFKTQALVTARDLSLNQGNFIGFSDGAYSSGTTATIQLTGAIDDAQSSLTPGQAYYLQPDDLSIATNPSQYFAGTALTATSLLIKGQSNASMVHGSKVFCGSYDFRRDGSTTGVLISVPSYITAADVRAYEIEYYGVGFAADGNHFTFKPYNGTSSVLSGNNLRLNWHSSYYGTNHAVNSHDISAGLTLQRGYLGSDGETAYSGNDVDNPKQNYDNNSGHGGQLTGRAVYTNSLKNGSYEYYSAWRWGDQNTKHIMAHGIASSGTENTTTNYANGFYFYVGNDSQGDVTGTIMEGVVTVYAIIN